MSDTATRKPRRSGDTARWARRQEQILDAAVQLFAEHGYSDPDTQLLAEKLQVGKGTLYHYFRSKRDLFLAAANRVMRQMRQCVDASIEGIEEPLDAGRIRDVPVERISDVMSNLHYGTMFTNFFTDQRHSVDAQARYILDIAFNGILSDSERQRLGVSRVETVDLTERT